MVQPCFQVSFLFLDLVAILPPKIQTSIAKHVEFGAFYPIQQIGDLIKTLPKFFDKLGHLGSFTIWSSRMTSLRSLTRVVFFAVLFTVIALPSRIRAQC